jgi:hypothetical protein
MEITKGVAGSVSDDEAYRLMAEREYFLTSKPEVSWRRSLKVGDHVYVEDDAGYYMTTHSWKVYKVGRLNIHCVGISRGKQFHTGEIYTHIDKMVFEISTGWLAGKNVNKSYAISSKPFNPTHERGLTEQEFKAHIIKNASKSAWGPINEKDLHEGWLKYARDEEANR